MGTDTRKLPLLPVADGEIDRGAPTRPLAPPQFAAAGPPVLPPLPAPVAEPPLFAAPAAATPPPPAGYGPVSEQAIGIAPVAPPRAPRRWPLALASWLGGVVAGMLILTLALGLFGGPREVAASTGDPTAAWDSSITLTDAYLTAQARKTGTGQVQEPTLRVLSDGKLAMDGRISLLGRSVPLTARLQPSLVDGKLQMSIVSLQVGGLPLPQVIIDQIASGVAGATQPPAATVPTTLVKLEATEGKLVIYSKVK